MKIIMNFRNISERLRTLVETYGGRPEELPPGTVISLEKRAGAKTGGDVKILGINLSPILNALRSRIYKVSGSAEKEAEMEGKGFMIRTFEALGAKTIDRENKVLRFSNKRVVLLTSIIVVVSVVCSYGFTSWSVGYTSSEKFCIGCREMEEAYRTWKASSHYDNQSGVVAGCADCHLPTDTISKMKVKTLSGMKDTFVHYFGKPEELDHKELAEKARASITNDSCMKCHKNLFPSAISKGGLIAHRALIKGEKKKCVDCHINFVHNVKPLYGARNRQQN